MDEAAERTPGNDPLPPDDFQQKEEYRLLTVALSKLSEEKREVLILSRFQEMKYEEIGAILECPVGTVKARVHYALKDLRDEYMKLTKTSVEE